MNDYTIYKKEEIKYLEKEFKSIILSNYTLIDYSNLKRNLFISRLSRKNIPITNNHVNALNLFSNSTIKFKYSYLRYDSLIEYDDFIHEFYNINEKHIRTKVFFTNSGMSAITTSLLAIKKVLKKIQIILPEEDIYFETFDFINKYELSDSDSNYDILYLDTISKKFDVKENMNLIKDSKKIFAIIIDTTCFLPKDLKKIIDYSIEFCIPVILLRSHTKLDMMGSEISGLGSIVYLIPKTNNDFELLKNIIFETYYLLGKFGSFCLPNNFPEEIFTTNFKKINYNRIRRIEKNNFELYLFLKKEINKGNVLLPNHKKFVLYCLEKSLNNDVQLNYLQDKIEKITNNNVNFLHACSFGFDYIALDVYYDINIKNYVIRISMNDCFPDAKKYKLIGEFINDYI